MPRPCRYSHALSHGLARCHVCLAGRLNTTHGHVTDDVDHVASLGVAKIPSLDSRAVWPSVTSCTTQTSEHMTELLIDSLTTFVYLMSCGSFYIQSVLV